MKASVAVNQRAQKRLQSGNLWVYKSDIPDAAKYDELKDGSIVDITDGQGKFLARGYFNGKSQISLRVLSYVKDENIDSIFIQKRITAAIAKRRRHFDFNKTRILRLVHSEADLLPGFIADMFGDVIVVQSLSAGAERFLKDAVACIQKELKPQSVFIKNDAGVRRLEGLESYCTWEGRSLSGPQKVTSDGIHYLIDFSGGQKTGFFADQRRAYDLLAHNVTGGRFLDCCSYSGAFSMNAFMHGAGSSVLVDISADAIALAKETAKLNGCYDKCEFVVANAFDYLKENYYASKKGGLRNEDKFDFIVLDPPTFTKSKAALPKALAGYKELMLRAAELVKKPGKILSCSCSFHVGIDDFYRSQCDAFSDARATAYTLSCGFQDERDHPMLTSMPETLYLKYFLFEIV
ncbi:MAG TPA: class I SAM-dependent rRNA methyltransferase [Candidatus Wallbacteria bacterium]|nr:class I SAM-dependent rRNA methyltransferase [Candidatus Wallbacteria bacterium]